MRLVLAVLLAVGVLQAAPAVADGSTGLAISGYADLAVDEAHSHVFVSQGQGSSELVVTDLDGTPVTRLPGMSGARGMTLSEDGTALYVALAQGHAIAAVDTSTLAVTTFPMGVGSCPVEVAETAGQVWFDDSCDDQSGTLGVLDPTDGAVTPGLAGIGYSSLATSPALPGSVFAAARASVPSRVRAFDVTGGASPQVVQRAATDVRRAGDIGITPDGGTLIASGGDLLATSDLSPSGREQVDDEYSHSVAVRADGTVAIGAYMYYGPDVWVFEPGQDTPFRTYDFAATATPLVPGHGLAFGATDLYVVTYTTSGSGGYALHRITPRPAATLAMTTDKATYDHGARAVVSVHLTTASADRSVAVYAARYGEARQLVDTVDVDAQGEASLRVRVTRKTVFTAEYDNAETSDHLVRDVTVKVRGLLTGELLGATGSRGGFATYPVGQKAVFKAVLASAYTATCLRFETQTRRGGVWGGTTRSRCVALDRARAARLALAGTPSLRGVPVRVRARWGGDDANVATQGAWFMLKFV